MLGFALKRRAYAAAAWDVKVKRDANAKRAISEIVDAFLSPHASVTDASIANFFQPQPVVDRMEARQCVAVLKRLADETSLRSSALNYTPELRNKQQWQKLIRAVGERALTMRHARQISIMGSNTHFIELCGALNKLRFSNANRDTVQRLIQRVPHDAQYCFPHVLRLAAEVDERVMGDELLKEAGEFCNALERKQDQPVWLPAHLAASLSMLFHGDVKQLSTEPSLKRIHAWIWKRAQATTPSSALSTADLLDLYEHYLTFKDGNGVHISGDFFLKMRTCFENNPRAVRGAHHTSRFQSQVAQTLTEMAIEFQPEAMDGAVDFIVTVTNKQRKPQRLALQCYGPTHLVFDASRLEGRTLFREHLLRAYLPVTHVTQAQWEYYDAAADRRSYLDRVLKSAV